MNKFSPFNFTVEVSGTYFSGQATPIAESEKDGVPLTFFIRLEGGKTFDLKCTASGWKATAGTSKELVDAIGSFILLQYE